MLSNNLAIFKFIKKGNIDKIKELLKDTDQINSIDKTGCSPLIYSIQKNRLHISKLLINSGADIHYRHLNKRNKSEYDALRYAIDARNMKAIELLVDSGANLNGEYGDKNLLTILFLEMLFKDSYNNELMDLLLEKGIDISVMSEEKYMKWLFRNQSSRPHDKNRFEILLKYSIKLLTSSDKEDLLFIAVKNSLDNCVRLLIENRVKINCLDYDSRTPLMYSKSLTITKLLVENGANVNIIDDKGNTASDYANRLDSDSGIRSYLFDHDAKYGFQLGAGFYRSSQYICSNCKGVLPRDFESGRRCNHCGAIVLKN